MVYKTVYYVICLLLLLVSGSIRASSVVTIPEVMNDPEPVGVELTTEAGGFEISADDIDNSPSLDIGSLLKQEQSVVRVTNNSGDSSQSSLSLRGFGDNAVANTLILVDGFPLTNPTLLSPNFNSIDLSDIESINIIQGSRGTLYGDQAVGGVVSITTKHPKKFIAALTAGLGSFKRNDYSAYLGTRFKQSYYAKGYYFQNRDNHYRQHQTQTNQNISLTGGMAYTSGDVRLTLQRYKSTTEFPGGLTEQQYLANPKQATNAINHADYVTTVYQLLNQQTLSTNWILETRLETRRIQSQGFLFSHYQRQEWMNTVAPELLGDWFGGNLISGYLFQNSDYELNNTLQANQAHSVQQNIYSEYAYPLMETIKLTLGGRYAWQDDFAEDMPGQGVNARHYAFVTEQGLQWQATKSWRFYLRRDGNFRFAKANEQVWTHDGSGKLKTQTGVSYEAGVVWEQKTNQIGVNIYQLNLDNEIAFDPTQTPEQPFGSYRNFSRTRRYGVTLSDKVSLITNLTMQLQLNAVNARFVSGNFSGNAIPAVPALNGNIGLDYALSDAWHVSENALYTGKRYASDDDQNIGGKLPGYWLHTVALQYRYRDIQVSGEINNLFDQRYPNYVLYEAMQNQKVYYPGSGRSYLLSVKVDIA